MSRSFAFSSKGVTLFVTYACFGFLCISIYNIIYAITGRLIDHGPGWSGYRSSAMIRFEDRWHALATKEEQDTLDPFEVGGRTALGPRSKMFRLSRWLRDSAVWRDEENAHVKGVNKTLIRGNPVNFRQNRSASIYRTIDLRRWCSQVAGLSMILLHVSLFLKDVQWKQRMAYIAQYAGIKETWDGLDTFGRGMPTGCAYYDQSNVPIRMYLDASDRSSATTNSALFGLNQAFLIMFSLSVTLVSITNQKEYGNIGWGISLIGPRMSSVSIGWMLLHLCFATFSQALFPDTLWLYYVCKGIIYFTGIIGCTHLILAEDLTEENHKRHEFGARRPFYGGFFNFRDFERSDIPVTTIEVVPEDEKDFR
ncbi:hypothetical protein FFLO_05261 [Filobasidium floriforme]|uniref:Uncharacterized protein n=1 Tax=Filobasidium floriforme TaxID=5210 RepID=A0A8K0NP46_9TREE|nr:hypothetical protein FFLO_05261 [Filobasidium floriforme]